MSDFITRIETELNELNERLDKLDLFIGNNIYCGLPKHHKELLDTQFSIMNAYSEILAIRLRILKDETQTN